MNLQIDDVTLMAAVASVACSAVFLILAGVWRLLETFKRDLSARLGSVDSGLKDRQEAWKQMLEAHIQAETLEFESLHELRRELSLVRQELEASYPTRKEMNEHLGGTRVAIEEICRIVDARTRSGADPVSGLPIGPRHPDHDERRHPGDE